MDEDGELVARAVLPENGTRSLSWRFVIDSSGILAWDENPELFQKIYVIEQSNGEILPDQSL